MANSTLDRNLSVLGAMNAALARKLAETAPAEGLEWVETGEGLSAAYAEGGVSRALASRRGPRTEGERWASQADLSAHAVFVVRGMGLGYHIGALVRRVKGNGAVLVFEPDVRLLRAVLERIDCTEWLGGVCVLTDPDDRAALVEATQPIEPLIAMGTSVLDHPASAARLAAGGLAQRFAERFTAVVATVRVSVASTLVQTQATLRNCLQNTDHYAACAGIGALRGALAGRKAVVVSAGPSLERNVTQLARPGVRDRFVIIAVQTVLKPLLARGIRPHFVCALDYHEVSRRFYEGLTAESVAGVTLVAEPKVNPAVPVAFPGRVRMVGDGFLDLVLGNDDAGRGDNRLKAGTTVAHLCCYLARHLGCDPVCLIGQDLGFTDGQYYAAGASIHGVWGAELNEFKTLETLEWQRIVRHRPILRRETDHLGRPVYTDEQMHTYLTQFARDFRADAESGLTTIDATEGGVRKPDTVCRALSEVIDAELGSPAPAETVGAVIERIERAEGARDRAAATARATDRLTAVRKGAARIGELCRRAGVHLSEAAEHQADQERIGRLVGKLDGLRAQVRAIEPAWSAVQLLNQAGAFRRMRADRAIAVEEGLAPVERQRRQIERDAQNVRWLAESADEMGVLLDGALATLAGGERVVRDPPPAQVERGVEGEAGAAGGKALALVTFDSARTWWGAVRDPLSVRIQGRTALSLTLERIGRAQRIGPIVVVTDDPALAARAAEGTPAATLARVAYERSASPRALPYAVARAARSFASGCWRGGHTDLTCFDEALDPGAAVGVLARHGGSGAGAVWGVVAFDASWALVDPALIDAVVARHAEDPVSHRYTFAHAAPGLGAAFVEPRLLGDLAGARSGGGLWGSLGGLLGYSPVAPAADVIARGVCVALDATVRQTLVRATADTPCEAAWLECALARAGLSPIDAPAARVAAAVDAHAASVGTQPRRVELRLSENGVHMDVGLAESWIAGAAGQQAAGAAVTLRDAALTHPALFDLLAAARRAAGGSLCVHLRTDLCCDHATVDRILAAQPDIVSVDCRADSPAVYAALTGRDASAFAQMRSSIERLVEGRTAAEGSVRLPLVVPRLTRCDAVYEQVEGWYDRHLLACGWAVLDPLEAARPGERIAPLPLPEGARRGAAMHTVAVLPGGGVVHGGAS